MSDLIPTAKQKMLKDLSDSWPRNLQLKFNNGEIDNLVTHPLSEEVAAAIEEKRCCLPFFLPSSKEIAWFNIARDADDLHSTIQSIRCWFIPSYGWEDDRGWIVTDIENSTGLAKQIADMSPAGYLRWRSKQSDFEAIAKKLSQIRLLESAKPDLPPNGPPPLIQIRQEFITALVVGDKESADNAIRLIEAHQLDTADNTLFMRVRYWFTFCEYDRITKHEQIHRLTQLRIPKVVQQCLVRSFYFSVLEHFNWESEFENILTLYKLDIHEVIGGLIRRCGNDEGVEIVRLRICYALANNDAAVAAEIISFAEPDAAKSRLEAIVDSTQQEPKLTKEEQFLMARVQRDWGRLQKLGEELLSQAPDIYAPFLQQSLEFLPNEQLSENLSSIVVTPPAKGDGENQVPVPKVESWLHWFECLGRKAEADFKSFLSDRPEQSIGKIPAQTIVKISNQLEAIYLDTDFNSDQATSQLLLSGLPEFMQDFVNEPLFPRDILVGIYRNLFRLWSELKCGSSHPPDSQVLLSLAEAILSFDREFESEIVTQFEAWWSKSPAKSLLPFLLGVVDLLDSLGTEEQCSNFWIAGATYLQNNPKYLTVGERKLWRQIGIKFFDKGTIDEYLPVPEEAEEVDPLQVAGLKKVAIVSMRDPQAKAAAEMIRERSGADVVLVTKKTAGSQTASAITADVVLFVWRATSHAVFRAFDNMEKEKLSYVQGTGVGSIVLALERWVANRSSL